MSGTFRFRPSPERRQDSHIIEAGIPGALGLTVAPNMIQHHLRHRATAMVRTTPILTDGPWSTSMEALGDLLEVRTEPQQDGNTPISGPDQITNNVLGITVEPAEQIGEPERDQTGEEDSAPSRKSTVGRQAKLQLICPKDGSLDRETTAVEANLRDSNASLVFVCGLGGHYINTWKSPKNSKFVWMGEALHKYAPQARVFAYRYNSRLWRKGEIDKQAGDLLRCIRDLPERPPPKGGRRPIIFVAHSTGGLIVKKLLVEAATKEPSPEALVAVSPRLSGHPPDISGAPNVEGVFRNLQSKMEPGFDEDLLRKSDFLVTLDADFKKLDAVEQCRFRILSYYSSVGAACTKIGPLEVSFPTETATLDIPGDIPIRVEKDHFLICKYDGADDKLFTPLALAIRRMVDASPDREVAPGWALRRPTQSREQTPSIPREPPPSIPREPPPSIPRELPPAIERDIEVSVVEFHKSQKAGGNSGAMSRPVLREDSYKINLSELIELGPLKCTQTQRERERSSTDASSVPAPGGFQSRYEFRWIHVPDVVESWTERILGKISEETLDPTIINDLIAQEVWAKRRHGASHKASHGRFMEPSCSGLPTNPAIDAAWNKPGNNWQEARQGSLILFMPYLHWDTFGSHQKRRACLQPLEHAGSPQVPQPQAVSAASTPATPSATPHGAKTLEHQLPETYWNDSRPIHARRSLDGFYYPNLKDLEARDKDQVLYKHTKDPSSGHSTAKMLMVDQLWMWVVGDHTILTFFAPNRPPPQQGANINNLYKEADLYTSVYEALKRKGDGDERISSTLDMVSLLIERATTVLLSQTDHAEMRITDCFREYIHSLTARQTNSLESFRNYLSTSHLADASASLAQLRSPLSIRDELDMVVNIRDTIDELGCLKRLFEVQTEVVRKAEGLFREAERTHRGGEKSAVRLEGVVVRVGEFEGVVDRLIEAAKRTQDSMWRLGGTQRMDAHWVRQLQNLLDLKQKEANVSEARSGNLQAQAAYLQAQTAQRQGKTILIFTVVTIIFLPLNFLTSLFGVNARELTGQPGMLTFRTVGLYTGTIAAAVISVCFLIAFNSVFRVYLFETCDFVLLVMTTVWAFVAEFSGLRGAYRKGLEVAGRRVGVRRWLLGRREWLREQRDYKLAERYVGSV
ncbi:hypothetical protein FGG08_007498 [Glutinoglossum americanum]|uniref:Uncharacterized protein n=1 Tax=Glutinoglossum americanum TaxID=1670608 RepID=A0A9P8HTS7_9PEZI|nr:hypothetical protein FGG08_007498 [Glutinoglossum americanum]